MTARDDAETLYARAATLQRELERVRAELDRLRDAEDRWEPETPVPARDAPPPEWLSEHKRRASLLEDARERVGHLDDGTLSIVVPVLDELAKPLSDVRGDVVAQLRVLVELISRSNWAR